MGACGTVPDTGGGVNGGGFGPAAFGEEGLDEVEGGFVFGCCEEEDGFGGICWCWCCCCWCGWSGERAAHSYAWDEEAAVPVVSEVVGSAETEERDSAEAEGGRQQRERGNDDDEGRAKKPTQEHLLSLLSGVGGGRGEKEKCGLVVEYYFQAHPTLPYVGS